MSLFKHIMYSDTPLIFQVAQRMKSFSLFDRMVFAFSKHVYGNAIYKDFLAADL